MARVDARSTMSSSKGNPAVGEIHLPQTTVLAIGAVVMILADFIVEWGLFNEAVGTVVDIVAA